MYGFIFLLGLLCINVRYSTEATNEKRCNKLAVANNELGVKLYHELIENVSENVFFSPLSLSTAFGMLFVGTGGNSAKQLRNVLGYEAAKLRSVKVPSAFNQYLNTVLPENKAVDNEYVLDIANEILLSENFNANSGYKDKVQNFFHANVEDVDFAGNTDQVIKEVNDFVSQQTHGKIDQLLTDLSPATIFLILNAVYFKGTWQTEFDKKLTKDEVFYNYGQEAEAKDVPIMHIEEKFPFFENDIYKIIELPYKGKDISMLVLLPTALDGLQDIEENISAGDIKTFREQLVPTEVYLSLPKFKINYSRQMSSDFNALGAKDIFNPQLANFSPITEDKGLFVNKVIHKAAVEVNEVGSEAAAATGIGGTALAFPQLPVFIANHPFLVMILDKRNSLVLFLGRVTNL